MKIGCIYYTNCINIRHYCKGVLMFDESLTDSSIVTPAQVLKEIKEKTDRLYTLKLASDAAEKLYKNAKNELSKILEESGVDKVQGDLCTVSLSLKTSVSVPKDELQKFLLFKYIEREYNTDVLNAMLTINARTFSSWHDKEISKHVEAGDIDFKLSMLEPYTYYSIGIRKRSKSK